MVVRTQGSYKHIGHLQNPSFHHPGRLKAPEDPERPPPLEVSEVSGGRYLGLEMRQGCMEGESGVRADLLLGSVVKRSPRTSSVGGTSAELTTTGGGGGGGGGGPPAASGTATASASATATATATTSR